MSPGTWAKENRRSNRAKVPWVIRSNDIIDANFNKAINDLKIVMIRIHIQESNVCSCESNLEVLNVLKARSAARNLMSRLKNFGKEAY